MKHYEAATIILLAGAILIALTAAVSEYATGTPDSPDAVLIDDVIEATTGI